MNNDNRKVINLGKPMSKTAQEHLENFIDAFSVQDQTFEELKKFITLTQQNECLYVGRISVEGQLMGIYSLLKMSTKVDIKPIINSSSVVKDFVLHLENKQEGKKVQKTKVQCRLVKELEVRKTGKDGDWGVNANSFKHIK